MPKYQNKSWLKNQLYDESKHPVDLAEECDVHKNTIWNWMRRYNLENQSRDRGTKDEVGNQYNSKDNLGFSHQLTVKEYVDNQKPGSYWLCEWENGEQVIKKGVYLRKRHTNWAPPKLKTIERLYMKYKEGAKQRNLNFTLPIKQFEDLVLNECYYCGAKPKKDISKTVPHPLVNFKYNGIDRKNNSKGYTEDNTVTACWDCNKIKGSRDIESFLSRIRKIYKNCLL